MPLPIIAAVAIGAGVIAAGVGTAVTVKCKIASRKIPEKVTGFEKVKLLGQGGFGAVYVWKKEEKEFAGKEVLLRCLEPLRKNPEEMSAEAKQLKKEINLLQKLDHENIVKLVGFHQDDTKLYMFMERMELSLTDLVENRSLQEDEARLYTCGILDGLIYLHSNAVIHCDIKGANVLLKENKFAKLCDFGISRHYSDGQSILSTKHAAGSLPYMAPEILKKKQHGKRSDVWAVGCTVYEMMHRKPPFQEEGLLITINTMAFEQKDLVEKSDVLNDNEKDFLLPIFVEMEKRPYPEQLRAHAWLE